MNYKDNSRNDVLYISIVFTLTVLVFVYGSALINTGNYYIDAFLGEFLLILLPPLIFVIAYYKNGKKKLLRINKISISNSLLSIGLILFSLPLIGGINSFFYYILTKLFGKVEIYQPPVPQNDKELVISLLVIAVVPAICEEFLFRGLIQGVFRKYGIWFSIIFTAILFSFLHLDFQKFFGILILGGFIGFIVYRTNSLFAGMLAHFANNAAAVVLSYATKDLEEIIDQTQTMTENNYNVILEGSNIELITTVFSFLMFAVTFGFLLYIFIKNTKKTVVKKKEKANKTKLLGIVAMLPAIGLFVYLYISQGFHILGKESYILETIKNTIGFGY